MQRADRAVEPKKSTQPPFPPNTSNAVCTLRFRCFQRETSVVHYAGNDAVVARGHETETHISMSEIAEIPRERISGRIGEKIVCDRVIMDRMDDRHVSNRKEMTSQTVCDELEGVVKPMMMEVYRIVGGDDDKHGDMSAGDHGHNARTQQPHRSQQDQ